MATFILLNPDQGFLLPPDLKALLAKNDLVRFAVAAVEHVSLGSLELWRTDVDRATGPDHLRTPVTLCNGREVVVFPTASRNSLRGRPTSSMPREPSCQPHGDTLPKGEHWVPHRAYRVGQGANSARRCRGNHPGGCLESIQACHIGPQPCSPPINGRCSVLNIWVLRSHRLPVAIILVRKQTLVAVRLRRLLLRRHRTANHPVEQLPDQA